MSRPKKGPRCGSCRHLGAPTDKEGDRLLGKGSGYRFQRLAPIDLPPLPSAFEVKIVKTLVTVADGENCPAFKAISEHKNLDRKLSSRKRQPITPAEEKNGNNEPAVV